MQAFLVKNKKLTLGIIFLMLIVLLFQLVSLINESDGSKDDDFEITGAYFILQTQFPEKLKNFYMRNFNFYQLEIVDNLIANNSVRINLEKNEKSIPKTIYLRTNHLSRIFRKLIKNKIDFVQTKHLDKNNFLTFSVLDPDSNLIIVIEE